MKPSVRKYTNTPLYIGFGVDEKTCQEKAVGVDGVIVGFESWKGRGIKVGMAVSAHHFDAAISDPPSL